MRRIHQLLAGATLALLTPAVAHAQDAAPAQAADAQASSSDGDDIVVTARRREERLQDVPISVTAVTADTIEREQINSIRDIAAFAPGLTINSDAVGRAFVSIRGIGTTLIDTVQPGVGIFIDGIYQPNTSYLNNPVVDVERIEVMRGPQGTLFGNNTLGGAINVITRSPTDTFSGRFTADYAGPDNYETIAGSISGPIIPGTLRGRIAANYHSQDGFSENTIAGGDARPLEHQSVNSTLDWDASSNVDLTLNTYWDRVEGSQTAYSNVAGPRDYQDDITLNQNSIATYTYFGGNLRGVYDLDGLNTTITSVLAYDHKDGRAAGDGDFGPVDFIRVRNGHNTLETFTGELRFDTRWNDRISTLIGVFGNASSTTNSFQNVVLGTPFPVTSQNGNLSAEALYGTVFINLTDTLELDIGGRVDHQKVSVDTLATDYEATEFEPRFTLSQHWTPNHMTYASISRGFRGGGANTPGAPQEIYQGDSVWTYELGDKFTSDDGRLTLNTSVYYNDYQHYIGQNSLYPVGPSFIAINLNTGTVESYGFEIEGLWRPTDQFSLATGITYNHSRVTDDSDYREATATLSDPDGRTLPSDRILFLPDWNVYVTPSYTIPIGQDDLRFDASLIYKGDRIGSSLSQTVPAPVLDDYFLLNANIAYEHDNWTFALWGTNLTDEDYWDSYLNSSLLSEAGFPAPLVHNLGITGDGRRVGVRVSAKF